MKRLWFLAIFSVCAATLSAAQDDKTVLSSSQYEECLSQCHESASCVPYRGNFKCVCADGWKGDGRTCENIDECKESRNLCGPNADCLDNEGSFECRCRQGYRHAAELANPESKAPACVDIDECTAHGHEALCLPEATCVNTPGHYHCRCPKGFCGDGVEHCIDQCVPASPAQRVDCFPDGQATESMCLNRGCCWQPYSPPDLGVVPSCYYPLPANTYELDDVEETDAGLSGTLVCSGKNQAGDGTGGRLFCGGHDGLPGEGEGFD